MLVIIYESNDTGYRRVLRTELNLTWNVWTFSGRRGVHAFLLDTLDFDDELQDWIVKQVMNLKIPIGGANAPIRQKSHLLRSPFSKHPTTGLVSDVFLPSPDYFPEKIKSSNLDTLVN